ncbi:hypothetical protein A0H81_10803 [Grifola frondosa]|uniref:C3H1-type domain-containing protein n=1 Tax=Grifola frondosa TaxID=5627 RepID=A0A1C7LWP6_GRIFR|nr:hypothetical protein A0H81_10803 [Grifola frondosa]
MPASRCKWYDDETSEPINGGCRRIGTCRFVHPSEPGWNSALPAPRDLGGGRGRGRGRGGSWGGGTGRPDAGWGGRPSDSSFNADGGSGGGWGDNNTSAPKNKEADAWGTDNFGEHGPTRIQPAHRGGGRSQVGRILPPGCGWIGIATAWGASDTNDGSTAWGAAAESGNNTGLGSATKGGNNTARGTTANGGANAARAVTAKDGDSTAWGASEDGNGDSGSAPRDVQNTSTNWGVTESPQASPTRSPRAEREPAPSGDLAGGSKSTSHLNPFVFSDAPTPMEVDNFPARPPPNSSSRDAGFIISESADMDSRPGSPSPSTTEAAGTGVSQTQKRFVRALARAIRAHAECEELELSRERYKRLHHSKSFQNASDAARKQQSALRKELEQDLHKAKKRFAQYIDDLAQFPYGDPSTEIFDSDIRDTTVSQLKSYISEVTEWLENLRPVVRQHQAIATAALQRRTEEPPLKRRRGTIDSSTAIADPLFNTLLSRIPKLEERLADLGMYFEQLRSNTGARVHAGVEATIGRLGNVPQLLRARSLSHMTVEEGEVVPLPPLPEPSLNAEAAEILQATTSKQDSIQAQMVQLAKSVEDAKKRTIIEQRERCEIGLENIELKSRCDELEQREQHHGRWVQTHKEESRMLKARLEELSRGQPAPPVLPTVEEIAERAVALVMPRIHEDVLEALQSLKRGVDEALRKQQDHDYIAARAEYDLLRTCNPVVIVAGLLNSC